MCYNNAKKQATNSATSQTLTRMGKLFATAVAGTPHP
jgi:hypothetical protein